MQKKWTIKASIPPEVADRLEAIRELLLANRGLVDPQDQEAFFSPKAPHELTLEDVGVAKKTIDKTLKRLKQAEEKQDFIIIYGDYDADGITSTAILWEGLHELGFNVMPFLPHREEQGYGLKPKGIEAAIKQLGKPALLMTVDNGIVAFEGADFCKKEKIDLIICDHHEAHAGTTKNTENTKAQKIQLPEVGAVNQGSVRAADLRPPHAANLRPVRTADLPSIHLPAALAVIHSNQTSGAGLAYLLAKTIGDYFHRGDPKGRPYQHFLELAAIGVIADLVPLTGVSRSLAKHGLEQLPQTQRPGLRKLYEEALIHQIPKFSPYHVGFIIAPRLNATGRLEHCMDSLRLLCTKDPARATTLAAHLGSVNRQRQDLTHASVEQVVQSVSEKEVGNLIITHSETYNPGVIGLIAGKLVEQFYRPSIAIAIMGEIAKGSVRSVSGVNIIELLRQAQDEFLELGGHPMAAGFSVATDNIERLIKRLESLASELIVPEHLVPTLKAETELDFSDISLELFESLQRFAPFGMGNPTPIFISRNITVEDLRPVGKEGKHLKLRLSQHKNIKTPSSADTTVERRQRLRRRSAGRREHENTENKKTQKARESSIFNLQSSMNSPVSSLKSQVSLLPPILDGIFFSAGDWVKDLHWRDTIDIAYQLELNEWNGRTSIQLAVKDVKRAV